MKKRLLAALLLAAPFLLHAEPSVAVDGPGHLPGRPPLPPFLHGVDLDEAQQDRLFELNHRQMPELRRLAKEAGKTRAALHQLATAETYSDAEAQRLAERLGQAEGRLALLRAKLDRQAFEVLTPAQRQTACGKIRR